MTECYVSAADYAKYWGRLRLVPRKETTMSEITVTKPALPDADTISRVLLQGDLKQLTPAQKVSYYNSVCHSVGLNPLTQPFQYLVLNNKEVLYARRDATDQLRKIHQVSITIVAREVLDDVYVVTARATLPNGRTDESIGAVPIATLKGEARANALMKAETKSKRRVTLAICGLGMLDETEAESIPVTHGSAPMDNPPESVLDENVYAPAGLSGDDLPDGQVILLRWAPGMGKAKCFVMHSKQESLTEGIPIYDIALAELARECCGAGDPVRIGEKVSASGKTYINKLERVWSKAPEQDGDLPI